MSTSTTTPNLSPEEEKDNRRRKSHLDHMDAKHDQQITHYLARTAEIERVNNEDHTRMLQHAQMDHEQKLRHFEEVHGQGLWQTQATHDQKLRHMEEIHEREQLHEQRMWNINHPHQSGASP